MQKSHDRKTTDICKLRSVRRPRRHEQPHRKEAPLQLDQLWEVTKSKFTNLENYGISLSVYKSLSYNPIKTLNRVTMVVWEQFVLTLIWEFCQFTYLPCNLCQIVTTCPSRICQTEELTISKSTKRSVKQPWWPCTSQLPRYDASTPFYGEVWATRDKIEAIRAMTKERQSRCFFDYLRGK